MEGRRRLAIAIAALALGACDRSPAPVAMASSKPIAAVPAPAEAALVSGVTADDAAMGDVSDCALQATTFSSPRGNFGMVPCALSEDDPQAPAEFRFVHRDADGDTDGVQYVDRDTLAATVDETEPRFWDGHVMTLDLPQESGGVLLIANWTGKQFATSMYRYTSGEEDGLQLEWRNGALLATTSTDGQRRLLPGSADSVEPGAFVQESLDCTDTSDGLDQHLSLAVDTRGEVNGVSYLALTPAVDGTANSCSVDANSDDGGTDWSASADGTRTVTWDDGEVRSDGSEVEPSQLSLSRDGELYTLDVQVQHAAFCGQSSVLASRIVLRRGQKQCVKVEFR